MLNNKRARMLVRPKLLILTTLFDDPSLKIRWNASRHLDGRNIYIERNLQGMYLLTVSKYIFLFYFRSTDKKRFL